MPKIRSIEFQIESHDQGWTSERTHGTFSTSSWLEVSILRTDGADISRVPTPQFLGGRFSNPSHFHDGVSNFGWYLVKRPHEAEQGPQGGEGDFAWYLQGNRVAAKKGKYQVIWAQDGNEGNEGAGTGQGFLKELRYGDRVQVWARAKWAGWQCVVESVKVTVTYGF